MKVVLLLLELKTTTEMLNQHKFEVMKFSINNTINIKVSILLLDTLV